MSLKISQNLSKSMKICQISHFIFQISIFREPLIKQLNSTKITQLRVMMKMMVMMMMMMMMTMMMVTVAVAMATMMMMMLVTMIIRPRCAAPLAPIIWVLACPVAPPPTRRVSQWIQSSAWTTKSFACTLEQ